MEILKLTASERREIRQEIAGWDHEGLRRALWFKRRDIARPDELNPASNQYPYELTASMVRAEYKRRGWKVPKPTRAERPERFT